MISTITLVTDDAYETNRISQLTAEGANFVPEGTGPKVYAVTCDNASDWNEIHNYIINENEIDGIPNRKIECIDECRICDRIASYEMSDAEADQLRLHSKVAAVHLDPDYYQGTYKGRYERRFSTTNRYGSNVKIGRDLTSSFFPSSPGSSYLRRTGSQIYRHQQKDNPWDGISDTTIIDADPSYLGDGADVDIIVADDSAWYGHVEFVKTGVGEPTNFVGDNVLKSGFATSSQNGVCGVLDCVLDMPYYLDPDWFEGDASSRLMVRWDGTVVPVESYARNWWNNNSTSHRSSKYVSTSNGGTATGSNDFGTVNISGFYTRAAKNGSNTAQHTSGGYHATPCMSQAYGKTMGWAFNANKWHLNIQWSAGAVSVESYFKILKTFHQCKPNRSFDNTKNPTIASNSWGTMLSFSSAEYYWRTPGDGTGGVAFSYSAGTAPAYLNNFYIQGDIGVPKPPTTTAHILGKDVIDAGVIFVGAAGNENQQQVVGNHPNYDNYVGSSNQTLQQAIDGDNYRSYTTNRPCFPVSIGAVPQGSGGTDIFRTFNIGAISANQLSTDSENKGSYSNMGNSVDCYVIAGSSAAIDQNWPYSKFNRYDAYYTLDSVQSNESEDGEFGGTSSSCPTAAGLFATKLQYQRTWNWSNLKDWLSDEVTVQDASAFPEGTEGTTPTDTNWNSYYNLQGSLRRILWDAAVPSPTPPGPEPDPDDPTQLSPGVLMVIQPGGGLIFRNELSIKKLT